MLVCGYRRARRDYLYAAVLGRTTTIEGLELAGSPVARYRDGVGRPNNCVSLTRMAGGKHGYRPGGEGPHQSLSNLGANRAFWLARGSLVPSGDRTRAGTSRSAGAGQRGAGRREKQKGRSRGVIA